MAILSKIIALAPTILLLTLTAFAGAVYSRIDNLSLPIPNALTLLTVLLPLVTGISTQGASVLVRRAKKQKSAAPVTTPVLAIFGLLLIYDTIVATLATTYILPPSSLLCGLNEKWTSLFRSKNGVAIRAIQDTLNCCGFYSVNDRAWPFGFNEPSSCRKTFDRTASCAAAWRRMEQVNAGFILLIAIVAFIITVCLFASLLTASRWTRPGWAIADVSDEREGHDDRSEVRRLIKDGTTTTTPEFRDEPDDRASPLIVATHAQPRIEASRLQEQDDVWRD